MLLLTAVACVDDGGPAADDDSDTPQPNRAPVATPADLEVDEDSGANAAQLVASDPDGDALTYRIVSLPTRGTVTLTDAATGMVEYTPDADEFGADEFDFVASDGELDSAVATISISIVPEPNQAPTALGSLLELDEDSGPIDAWLEGTDPEGDALTFEIVSLPTRGTLVLLDADTGAYTYEPHGNAYGADEFEFRVADGELSSAVATVMIAISPIADVFTDVLSVELSLEELEAQVSTTSASFHATELTRITMEVINPDASVSEVVSFETTTSSDAFLWQVVEVNGGTVSPVAANVRDYQYDAPAQAGSYTIRVSSLLDPGVQAELPVTVHDPPVPDVTSLSCNLSLDRVTVGIEWTKPTTFVRYDVVDRSTDPFGLPSCSLDDPSATTSTASRINVRGTFPWDVFVLVCGYDASNSNVVSPGKLLKFAPGNSSLDFPVESYCSGEF